MVSIPQPRPVRWLGLATVATVACGSALVIAPAAQAATLDLTGVVINEVESNGDTTDWVELYNPTGDDVDLSEGFLSDADNDHAFPLSGTIAAGGYAVFDVSEGDDGFGLGAPESVRLFDGEVVEDGELDGFEWETHAPTTYGRDWSRDEDFDGLGDWNVTSESTRGAENVFPSGGPIGNITGVKINEVESDGDAVHGDWVELKNTTAAPIDITGAIITDSDEGHVFTVPATPTLASGAVAAFQLDADEITGFGLGAADSIHLYQPGDTLLEHEVDTRSWTFHAVNTFGLDGNTWKATAEGTFGTANTFATTPVPSLAGVVISEVKTTGDAVNGDWIELHNTSGGTVDLTNAILSDDSPAHALRLSGSLAAGQYKGFRVDDPAVQGNFGLGDADSARLFRSDVVDLDLQADQAVSQQEWTTHAHTSWGFSANNVAGVETHKPTINAANDFTSTIVPDTSWIVLNEIDSDATVGNGEDYIELKNTASVPLTIGGMILSDSGDDHHYAIPAGTTLAGGAVYLVEIDNVTGGFGLGSEDAARLFAAGTPIVDNEIAANAIPLDHHEWDEHPDGSWTRTAGGLGDWAEQAPTPGA